MGTKITQEFIPPSPYALSNSSGLAPPDPFGSESPEIREVKHLFHKLWGQCHDGVYEKPVWMALQKALNKVGIQA